MTDKQLIEEAKRRYKVGDVLDRTEFNYYFNTKAIIKKLNFNLQNNCVFCTCDRPSEGVKNYSTVIYDGNPGIWAKVIDNNDKTDFFDKAYSLKVEWKDKTVETIINRFIQRSELGIKKYNTTLDKNNLSLKEWLEHSIQEKLDDILYMQRALDEINK